MRNEKWFEDKYKEEIGDHVRFTKRTYKPYIDVVDLVNSVEFRNAVLAALADDEIPEQRTGPHPKSPSG